MMVQTLIPKSCLVIIPLITFIPDHLLLLPFSCCAAWLLCDLICMVWILLNLFHHIHINLWQAWKMCCYLGFLLESKMEYSIINYKLPYVIKLLISWLPINLYYDSNWVNSKRSKILLNTFCKACNLPLHESYFLVIQKRNCCSFVNCILATEAICWLVDAPKDIFIKVASLSLGASTTQI